MGAEKPILNTLTKLEKSQILPSVGELKKKVLLDHLTKARIELKIDIIHRERTLLQLVGQIDRVIEHFIVGIGIV